MMRIFEINKLVVVAAVAFLPIACGTRSMTAPDAALAVTTESTVSALRFDPLPLPPTAPEAPSTGTVPEKADPGTVDVPTPGTVPDNRNSRRPAPQPEVGSDPAPSARPSVPPVVPIGGPSIDPGPVPEPVKCLAASFEIAQTVLFMGTPGATLSATILDDKGIAILDDSCDKLVWTVESILGPDANQNRVSISYGADTRNVTLTGPAGTYKAGVMAINGAAASRLVTLQ
jgi:hypothetical protein